jgi:hypothetical protein
MAYSEGKLKSNGVKASPCFRPVWIGNVSNKHFLIRKRYADSNFNFHGHPFNSHWDLWFGIERKQAKYPLITFLFFLSYKMCLMWSPVSQLSKPALCEKKTFRRSKFWTCSLLHLQETESDVTVPALYRLYWQRHWFSDIAIRHCHC